MRALTEEDGENPLFALERGEITEAAFLERLSDGLEPLLGHRPQLHRFREVFFEALDPNQPMIELMRELQGGGLRMAMLTNNVREWEPLWRPMLPVDEIFETVVDSGFVGCPQAGSADLRDHPGAARPARRGAASSSTTWSSTSRARARLGMRAVHFRDNEQAIAEIRAALGDLTR